MAEVEDLRFLGAMVDDPVATAAFIGGLVLTRRQKLSLLERYLTQLGLTMTPEIRAAASAFVEV